MPLKRHSKPTAVASRTQDKNGVLRSEKWILKGILHRTDGPALQMWNSQGILTAEHWVFKGKAHRIDGPALQKWNSQGVLTTENWVFKGNLHRTSGPALRVWNDQGILTKEKWALMGEFHRTSGPALRVWNDQGVQLSEQWVMKGSNHRYDGPANRVWNDQGALIREVWQMSRVEHRTDGPALRLWNDQGLLIRKVWSLEGKLHRINGPAVRCWNDEGVLTDSKWFSNGDRIAPSVSVRTCTTCAKTFTKPLKACAHCQETRYCSKECQRQHWPEHKKRCAIDRARLEKKLSHQLPERIHEGWRIAEELVCVGCDVVDLRFNAYVWIRNSRKDCGCHPAWMDGALRFLETKLPRRWRKVLRAASSRIITRFLRQALLRKAQRAAATRVITRFFRRVRIRKVAMLSKAHRTFYTTAPTDVLYHISGFL